MKTAKAVVYAESVAAYPELCAGAGALADQVVAIVVGTQIDAASVAELGVEVRLLAAESDVLLDDYWPVVSAQVVELAPTLVLLRASIRVRALAGQLAVACGLPVAADPAALAVGEDGIEYTCLRYGGATEQAYIAPAVIAVVGPGLFSAGVPAAGGSVTTIEVAVPVSLVRLVSRAPRMEESVDLTAADVVIGVGRGIGSPENVAKAGETARALGAELACSRPIAEGLGWLPRNRYLGVSGAVVQPRVYLALGISGQVQHLVGVNGSKAIVAINKDKNAPIFGRCDLGLVADLETVLPVLTEQLR